MSVVTREAGLLDGALLRAIVRLEDEVAHLRRTLEAHTAALEAVFADLPPHEPTTPPPGAASPPVAPAPLPAGGGARQRDGAPADFPATFRGRTGGGGR